MIKTCFEYNISSVYSCVYMYMHVCIYGTYMGIYVHEKSVLYRKSSSTVFALHSKNNLLGIIDIGAYKPGWLQAHFARFYILVY